VSALNTQALVARLVDEFGYPEAGAKLIAADLAACREPVANAFLRWWDTGRMPEVEIQGYTVQRLMREQGMNPVAAFLALDWLNREPEKALQILDKGHDSVRVHRGRAPR
jgi:hypothetical protein